MDVLGGILVSTLSLLNAMAPYLLFGFLAAGVLHLFISTEVIARHLGRGNLMSVVKASLFGVPLPLCSCGVIPAAMALRRGGASRGATISFLISTPTTGVDSILATWSLLGPLFAAFRVVASFITGIVGGLFVNLFSPEGHPAAPAKPAESAPTCFTCGDEDCDTPHGMLAKARAVFAYAFVELLGGIRNWLVLGLLIGGLIAFLIPDDFFATYVGRGWGAMLAMLLVGIPLYVCATGSIPIAAALMLKGLSPGAAFVFLLAGPATNAVTITVVGKELGRKFVAIYLGAITVCALGFGWLLDRLWSADWAVAYHLHQHGGEGWAWLNITSSVVLVALLLFSYVRAYAAPRPTAAPAAGVVPVVYRVDGMTCEHCAATVTKLFTEKFGAVGVVVNLKAGLVTVSGARPLDRAAVKAAIEKAGYSFSG